MFTDVKEQLIRDLRRIPNNSYIKVYLNDENLTGSKNTPKKDGEYIWGLKIGMRNNRVLIKPIDEEITNYKDCYFLCHKKVTFTDVFEIKYNSNLYKI